MILRRETLPAFAVIGMEGSTREGEGFVARLWEKANARFDEIAPLISGTPRLWGLMTGPNRDFMPWEDGFSRGYTWPAWKRPWTRCPLRAGQNGFPPPMNTPYVPWMAPIPSRRPWPIWRKRALPWQALPTTTTQTPNPWSICPFVVFQAAARSAAAPPRVFRQMFHLPENPGPWAHGGRAEGAPPVGPHGRAIGPRRSAPGPDCPSKNYYQFRPASSSS